MLHRPTIDDLAVPMVFPRVGDNLSKLYTNVPPSPFRPRSVLKPIALTPSDLQLLSKPSDLAPSHSAAEGPATSHQQQLTTYGRSFELFPDSACMLNNPHAHLSGRAKMIQGNGTILGGFLAHSPRVAVSSSASGSDGRCALQAPASCRRSIPLPPTPPPAPPKDFADRLLAQADVEERMLLQTVSARKAKPAVTAFVLDASALRNRFLLSCSAEERQQPSPRRRLL